MRFISVTVADKSDPPVDSFPFHLDSLRVTTVGRPATAKYLLGGEFGGVLVELGLRVVGLGKISLGTGSWNVRFISAPAVGKSNPTVDSSLSDPNSLRVTRVYCKAPSR